jgi:hypothetical protein
MYIYVYFICKCICIYACIRYLIMEMMLRLWMFSVVMQLSEVWFNIYIYIHMNIYVYIYIYVYVSVYVYMHVLNI